MEVSSKMSVASAMGHGSVARRPSAADSKVRCWKIPKNLPSNIGVHGIFHVKKRSRV